MFIWPVRGGDDKGPLRATLRRNDPQHLSDGGVDGEGSGINDMGVRGSFHRCIFAAGIAVVAATDDIDDAFQSELFAFGQLFRVAAAGAHIEVGGDENLYGGIWANHGADIAAIEHGPRRIMGKITLELQQCRPHFRDLGDDGRLVANAGRTEAVIIQRGRIERLGGAGSGGHVLELVAAGDHVARHSAVQQPGVEAGVTKVRSYAAGESALARRRWPINGNNHGVGLMLSRRPPVLALSPASA
jgi:hypothetical protein